jgi:hypothetical protein
MRRKKDAVRGERGSVRVRGGARRGPPGGSASVCVSPRRPAELEAVNGRLGSPARCKIPSRGPVSPSEGFPRRR